MNFTRITDLLRFLIDAQTRGERTALVTITEVVGRSSRAPGAHLAVSETGAYRGSLSGGCVEAAVVGEAQRVIASGNAELVRFGLGSPYLDIRLPCGGGIDLLIAPSPPAPLLHDALQMLAGRKSIALSIARHGRCGVSLADDGAATGWRGDSFFVRHDPPLRLWIIGHGAEAEALGRLGLAYGAEIASLSPDPVIVDTIAAQGGQAWLLKTPAASPHLASDRHSAVVMLFHDHDWEIALLAQALEQDAFFIGAMGSSSTHRKRLEALSSAGVPAGRFDRVTGPIGLIPSTRDPETLALSVLAQVVAEWKRASGNESAAVPFAEPGSQVL